MKISTRYSVLIVLLCSLSSGYANAAGIYKWVDAEGNVHYGEQPPPEGAKQMPIRSSSSANQNNEPLPSSHNIDPRAQRDKMIQALEGDRLARQEKKQKQKKEQQKRKMQCARAKDTLRQYKSAASLYKLDAEGKRHTLPASVKQQETQRLQAEINKWCK